MGIKLGYHKCAVQDFIKGSCKVEILAPGELYLKLLASITKQAAKEKEKDPPQTETTPWYYLFMPFPVFSSGP